MQLILAASFLLGAIGAQDCKRLGVLCPGLAAITTSMSRQVSGYHHDYISSQWATNNYQYGYISANDADKGCAQAFASVQASMSDPVPGCVEWLLPV